MNYHESEIKSILIHKLKEVEDKQKNIFIGKVEDNYLLGKADLINEVLNELEKIKRDKIEKERIRFPSRCFYLRVSITDTDNITEHELAQLESKSPFYSTNFNILKYRLSEMIEKVIKEVEL